MSTSQQGIATTPDPFTIPGYVEGRWAIDPVHSEVAFTVRHLMVSKVRGRFVRFGGDIITAANPLDSSVAVEIDMASVDTADPERDEDLRSSTYLDVAQYPHMRYRSTGLRTEDGRVTVDGELTLHGVTRPVSLDVELNGIGDDGKGGKVAGFSARTQISRSDFGIDLRLPLTGGGVVVGDRIDIALEIEAVLAT
jgi:polyisoprenoid-binding protein YceI